MLRNDHTKLPSGGVVETAWLDTIAMDQLVVEDDLAAVQTPKAVSVGE